MKADIVERLRADIEGWEQAYPFTAFPEPDLKRAAEALKAEGMTLDVISASNMRHVVSRLAPGIHESLAHIEALTAQLARAREGVEEVIARCEALEDANHDRLQAADCGETEAQYLCGERVLAKSIRRQLSEARTALKEIDRD